MDRSKIGVLEEGDEVGLSSLLESHDGRGLEAQVRLDGQGIRLRLAPGGTTTIGNTVER